MNPEIEVKQEEVLAAAAALGAAIGGGLGWLVGDIQTSQQVSGKRAWVLANTPDCPERADLVTKLTELLNLLENTG